MNHPTNHRQHGFTLIEILIAVLIASVILVAIYGSVTRVMGTKEKAEDRAELFALGRDTVMRMADEIEGALPVRAGEYFFFRGSNTGSGSLPNGSVEFIARQRTAYGANRLRPGDVYVKYHLEPIVENRGLFTLYRTQVLFAKVIAEAKELDFPVDDPATVESSVRLLDCYLAPGMVHLPGSCARVVGLKFCFYGLGGGCQEEWNSFSDDESMQNLIPRAVQIVLSMADENGDVRDFKTVVDIPLARSQPTPTGQ